MATVGVVGLGAMGSRIARRLGAAGHELVVWNRDPAKAESLVAAGALAAATPADAARRAEAVITMVADPPALVDVTEGTDGVVGGLGKGTTLIQMSTVGPDSTSRLAALLPAEALLDSPVLGSVAEVESGTLSVFLSRLVKWTSSAASSERIRTQPSRGHPLVRPTGIDAESRVRVPWR